MRLQSAFRQNKSMKTRKTNLYLALSMAIVSVAGASPAMAQSAYDAQFITYPTYNGDDLELTVDNSGTHFRLWSPKAQEARVNIYDNGRFGKPLQTLEMKADPSNGTWTASVPEKLYGKYYTFQIKFDGKWKDETPGVWAKAVGVNGQRAAIIDLAKTNPEGWENDKGPKVDNFTDVIIYEMHHRDMSEHPSSGIANKGKFLAMTEEGTVTPLGEKTGIDHLKDLGVTHVHILPSYDYNSVDETNLQENVYNWGYDPQNYNAPEGSYSTNPSDPATRVREMKEMVKALHDAGIGVIMDVVYNHTYRLDSWLWRTAPWYYSRQAKNGAPSNGSACGNDTASERSMCAKYILESVLYWAEEYHMDGFRFDLMGLLDVELMQRIRRELDQRWGKGEKLLFGEPWSAGSTYARPGTVLAGKAGLPLLDAATGAFCDATRDAVKGSVKAAEVPGFVNGGGLDAETLANCVRGWTNAPGEFSVKAPSQTITYLSSHDDWTLWDKLVLTMDPARRFDFPSPALLRANRLAAAICFTCQGRLFLLSGEEFARTKHGIKDSVRSPLEINRLDWRRAWENQELADYYRGLIALRMLLPGLQDKSAAARERVKSVREPAKDCVTLEVENGRRWKRLFLAYSSRQDAADIQLPEGRWELLADGGSSFLWRSPETREGRYRLEPVSAAVFGLA